MKPVKPNGERDDALSYSPGVLIEATPRTLYISGQIGVDANGEVSPDFAVQVRQVWANLEAVLTAAGMELRDLVKITTYLIDPADFAIYAKTRTDMLQGHKPASTLVYVSGLVKPEWRVEIEAVAVFGG
jgi:enamine deaminase RidA (YjgF/YER057c/UK114 family)